MWSQKKLSFTKMECKRLADVSMQRAVPKIQIHVLVHDAVHTWPRGGTACTTKHACRREKLTENRNSFCGINARHRAGRLAPERNRRLPACPDGTHDDSLALLRYILA